MNNVAWIDSLQKTELEELLKNLRTYKSLVDKVWNRWKKIFTHLFNWKNEYIVEYYGELEKSYLLNEAKWIYKKVFWIIVNDSDISLVKNEKVKWGMKVYFNDNLIYLSFLKFYNLLK